MAVHAAGEPLLAWRWAATGTASLLLHALLLGMLARTQVTQLVLQPPGLLLLLGHAGAAPGQPGAARAEAVNPAALPSAPAAPAAMVAAARVPADSPRTAAEPPREDRPSSRQPDRVVEASPPAAEAESVPTKPPQREDARRGERSSAAAKPAADAADAKPPPPNPVVEATKTAPSASAAKDAKPAPAIASSVASLAAPGGSGGGAASQASSGTGAALRTAYEQQLFLWLEKHKDYPLVARRRGLEGVATLRVRIARDGHVLGTTMVQGSGEPMLDAATLDLASRADPFPRVPATIEGGEFEFTVPVEYRLR